MQSASQQATRRWSVQRPGAPQPLEETSIGTAQVSAMPCSVAIRVARHPGTQVSRYGVLPSSRCKLGGAAALLSDQPRAANSRPFPVEGIDKDKSWFANTLTSKVTPTGIKT